MHHKTPLYSVNICSVTESIHLKQILFVLLFIYCIHLRRSVSVCFLRSLLENCHLTILWCWMRNHHRSGDALERPLNWMKSCFPMEMERYCTGTKAEISLMTGCNFYTGTTTEVIYDASFHFIWLCTQRYSFRWVGYLWEFSRYECPLTHCACSWFECALGIRVAFTRGWFGPPETDMWSSSKAVPWGSHQQAGEEKPTAAMQTWGKENERASGSCVKTLH